MIGIGIGMGVSIRSAQVPAATAPEPPAESSVLVSGAGTAAVNATYTPRGTDNGKPYYNLVGQPDDPGTSSVWWNTAEWNIIDGDSNTPYRSVDGPDFPWQVVTWVTIDGDEPVPTVTEA